MCNLDLRVGQRMFSTYDPWCIERTNSLCAFNVFFVLYLWHVDCLTCQHQIKNRAQFWSIIYLAATILSNWCDDAVSAQSCLQKCTVCFFFQKNADGDLGCKSEADGHAAASELGAMTNAGSYQENKTIN